MFPGNKLVGSAFKLGIKTKRKQSFKKKIKEHIVYCFGDNATIEMSVYRKKTVLN